MGNVPMTRPDLALAIHDTRYFHDSTFACLDGGRLLHFAYGRFSVSEDGGVTWGAEFTRADASGEAVGSTCSSLVELPEGGVGLAGMRYAEGAEGAQRGRSAHLVFWRSPDGGETWEPPVRITDPGVGTHALQDVLLKTASGRLVLPVYIALGQGSGPEDRPVPTSGKLVNNQWVGTAAHFFDGRFSAVYVCYSDDGGRSWQRNEDGELTILQDWNATFSYVNEPSVTEVEPGRLLMFMRTGLGRLFQAWSDDEGMTWTRPQPTLLSSSTAPAQIRTLPNGHLLAVWNQEGEEEVKRGYNRTRISAAISRDGGSVWEFFQNIESLHQTTRVEPGPIAPLRPEEIYFTPGLAGAERDGAFTESAAVHGRWSYPSVKVLDDRVLVAHTYSIYEEHPTRAEMAVSSKAEGGANQKLKVLPLNWFYGGKEPADNPFLRRAYEQAKP